MIQVEHLHKKYGATAAITDINFEVERGQVVGFLGPNGAGKSTTMRILTGALGATSGRALFDGKDVFEHPREVKRRIGYLPEVPPLYPNMVVRDYVRFAARLKGLSDEAAAADKVIERVGLQKVSHRIIEHLSKGYRQRVGIAQALVHDPEVLVLDEPNSGLDIAQRIEIRELLVELASDQRTIILSTHVLADIEAICRRVLIISEGRLVGQGDIQTLGGDSRSVEVVLARPTAATVATLGAVPGVIDAEDLGANRFRIRCVGDQREAIAAAALPFGLIELVGRQSLEDIYLRLTQGGSR